MTKYEQHPETGMVRRVREPIDVRRLEVHLDTTLGTARVKFSDLAELMSHKTGTLEIKYEILDQFLRALGGHEIGRRDV